MTTKKMKSFSVRTLVIATLISSITLTGIGQDSMSAAPAASSHQCRPDYTYFDSTDPHTNSWGYKYEL
jgi:ABC-type oligopeptide transport system substrate-binding subunit